MNEIEEKDKKTILIVDDEKPIVDILVYNIQKEGYNTLEAADRCICSRDSYQSKT